MGIMATRKETGEKMRRRKSSSSSFGLRT